MNLLSKCERGLILPDERFFARVALVLEADPYILHCAHESLTKTKSSGEGYLTAPAIENYKAVRVRLPDPNKIHILDLFCGVGGFSRGFEDTHAFQVTSGVDLLSDRIATFTANHLAASAWCSDIHALSFADISDDGVSPRALTWR